MQGMQQSIEVEKTMWQIAQKVRDRGREKGKREQPRWLIKLKYGESEKQMKDVSAEVVSMDSVVLAFIVPLRLFVLREEEASAKRVEESFTQQA